jgi:3-deoxy-D-manno-octulosonic-acid transferase
VKDRLYICRQQPNIILLFVYNLLLWLFVAAIRLASLWNKKARKWVSGRRNLFEELEAKGVSGQRIIWMHCSSAGELEQGKPVAEALKKQYPSHKLLVSFFSPSGYEVAQRYAAADFITYLPSDTRKNARKLLTLIQPELVVFVKYEFWYHHLNAIAALKIPLLLVSSSFRKDQVFFKWYGGFYRRMLFLFRHIFVQDTSSLELLQQQKVLHSSISGDTRFDRVVEIAAKASPLPLIERFAGKELVVVAGSTWPDDEQLLYSWIRQDPKAKLILAPHELSSQHLAALMKWEQMQPLSRFKEQNLDSPEAVEDRRLLDEARILLVDCVGILSQLYRYATVTYIGGGFTRDGIHNTLEAAVYGKPVLFGPNYKKYREARELIECGAAMSLKDQEALDQALGQLLSDNEENRKRGQAAATYVSDNKGATGIILRYIQENRLLTSE